jgi:hypothetical protein
MKHSTPNFIIHHHLDKRIIEKFADILENKSKKIVNKFEFVKLKNKIKIVLCNDKKEFCKKAGLKIPSATGWGNAKHGIIINLESLKKIEQIKPEGYGFIASKQGLIFPTILHELVHVYTTNIKIPMWMHEGLADYFSGVWNHQYMRIYLTKISKKRFFKFSELKERFDRLNGKYAQTKAHDQSLKIVTLLVKKFGEKKLIELLQKAQKLKFTNAFTEVYGLPVNEFEKEFRKQTA